MLKTASLVNCRKVHRLKPMDKFDYALLLISWQVRLLFSRSIFKMRIEVTYFGQFYSPELQGNIQNNFAFLKKTSFCFENYSISLSYWQCHTAGKGLHSLKEVWEPELGEMKTFFSYSSASLHFETFLLSCVGHDPCMCRFLQSMVSVWFYV